MPTRPIEDTPTSPYAVLGVSRHATTEQIKKAYRLKAKAAHPDAGGSAIAMEQVNEAYRVLGNADERRKYDEFNSPGPATTATATRRYSNPSATSRAEAERPAAAQPNVTHPTHARPSAVNESEHIRRGRHSWARNSAWELFRITLPSAVVGLVIMKYANAEFADATTIRVFDTLAFIPIYFLTLSIIFLTNPSLRLVFADLVRRYPTSRDERIGALALVLAFFPLAFLWVLWQ